MNILGDMGVSKLSAKAFLKVNYSFNNGYFIKAKADQMVLCSAAP